MPGNRHLDAAAIERRRLACFQPYHDAIDRALGRKAEPVAPLAEDLPPRAILRLAHYEMTATDAAPKQVVSDAVELAKHFSTDRSPAFVNALLGKVLKRVLAARRIPTESSPPA